MLNAEQGRERPAHEERRRDEQVVPLLAVRDDERATPRAQTRILVDGARQCLDRSPIPCLITLGSDHRLGYANGAFRSRLAIGDVLDTEQPFERAVRQAELGVDDTRLTIEGVAAALETVYQTQAPVVEIELPNAPSTSEIQPIPTSLTAWPVFLATGAIAGVAVQLRDRSAEVRERREREALTEQMRQINQGLLINALREEELTQLAEAASEAKSAFLATMSHELRTPLTAILGYEELLADGITGPVTDDQRTQLRRIKISAMHLLALIDQMLTLSRVEAGREEVQLDQVEVSDIVDQAITLVAPLAENRSIRVRSELPDHPLRFSSDVMKLRQILVNLLANAVRFTDQGEIVVTATGPFPAARAGAPDDIVFTVRDTGIGISPQHLEAIFDPFWQVEQTSTRKVGGTGLGLNVSRRLAQLLGGDVTVESVLHEGSTFRVRLPVQHPYAG